MQFNLFIYKILEIIVKKNLPPTISSRLLFIYCSMIQLGLYICNPLNKKINFIEKYKIQNTYIECIRTDDFNDNLINYLSIESLKIINKSINLKNITDFLDDFEKTKEKKYLNFLSENKILLKDLLNEINNYYYTRDKDGWKKSNTQIKLINDNYIIVNQTLNSNNFNNINSWTPLLNQRMIGAKWGIVRGIITNEQFNYIEKYLLEKYKQVDLVSESKQILEISLNLNDEQKCIAEFWAGIGGSVTPPGFWNMFLYGFFSNNQINNVIQVEYFYKLNCGLFQASIVAWNIKYKCLECRPIQSIRLLNKNKEIDYYFGKSFVNLWKPYQKITQLTPPFPDYISGHSTFSSTASFILTDLLGSDITNINIQLKLKELMMLSPIFKNSKNEYMNLSKIIFEKNCSLIENNIPEKNIINTFKTWDELSKSAGMSRIYGGIHYMFSNLEGDYVGKIVGKEIINLYNV